MATTATHVSDGQYLSSYFKYLKQNRSKKNKFFNNGCSEFNDNDETTFLESGDYSICKDLVDKKTFEWHLRKQEKAERKVSNKKIKLRTLNSILIETNAPKLIDFLEELFVVNKDCEVVINTNLKKLSDKWKILIKI